MNQTAFLTLAFRDTLLSCSLTALLDIPPPAELFSVIRFPNVWQCSSLPLQSSSSYPPLSLPDSSTSWPPRAKGVSSFTKSFLFPPIMTLSHLATPSLSFRFPPRAQRRRACGRTQVSTPRFSPPAALFCSFVCLRLLDASTSSPFGCPGCLFFLPKLSFCAVLSAFFYSTACKHFRCAPSSAGSSTKFRP